ncbi:MAG: M16 family metallopeptidase, partial [Myxococcales bacterium]
LDYSEAAFRTEAGAILGEYLKSASDPEQKLYEKMMETAYTRHTYRHTVIGYLDDIRNMPAGYDYSREFFKRYYTPDDTTIFVVGDFDKAATLASIEKAYGGWTGKSDPQPVPAEPKQTAARRGQIVWNKPTLPRLWIAWHTPGAEDLKVSALQNLMNAYLFGVLLRVKDAKNLKVVESSILNEIKALAGGRLDAKRMDAVRSNLKYSNIMSLNKADAVALSLVLNTTLTGDVDFLNKEFDALAGLKPADLQSFAKKYLLDANRTTVTLVTGGAK